MEVQVQGPLLVDLYENLDHFLKNRTNPLATIESFNRRWRGTGSRR
jgi:hypothetical protein